MTTATSPWTPMPMEEEQQMQIPRVQRTKPAIRSRISKLTLGFAVCLVSCFAIGASALAADRNEIVSFDAGLTDYQAAGHPDASVSFRFALEENGRPLFGIPGQPSEKVVKGGAPKDVVVDMPKGLFGNPRVIPQCRQEQLEQPIADCPVGSQVGVVFLHVLLGGGLAFPDRPVTASPVFNMVPERGEVAKLAFKVEATVVSYVSVTVRSDGDYGLTATTANIFSGLPLWGIDMAIWGDPYNASHDAQRCAAPNPVSGTCDGPPGDPALGSNAAGLAPTPFMVAPAECGVDGLTELSVRSWRDYGDDAWTSATSTPQQVTGCDKLRFEPSVDIRPTSTEPDTPTGLDVELEFPQHFNAPAVLESPPLKDAVVTLPEGMSINPASADGLQACADERLQLRSKAPVTCPLASKIGTVEAETPVLDERLTGGVYLRPQASDDPASGEMFRLAIVLENAERGLSIRLPGQVRVNPGNGRIETTFAANPQLPVSKISLRLKSGPRSPLATPPTCGDKTIDTQLTSWAGHAVSLASNFTIPCPGASGFAPAFDAGSVNPTGGSFSPLAVRIERDDRQQFLSGVSVDLPEGLLAKVRGVPLCGSVQAEHGGCPVGSRIGTATVGAGPGSNPFYVKGDVFLTEGYKGGQYGLAVHVHAKAGPFDLGWVRVRQALHVDRRTAEVSVVSDPLPQIVKGVPVRLRDVRVDVDKPDFTVNPTSCREQRVDASLSSINGAVHRTGSRFQVGDCQALPFKPRLGLRLTGRRQIRTGRHPGVRAVVRQSGIGEAGIGRARVVLPKSLALDPENAQALCEFEDGTKSDLENHCPKGSIVGRARAKTPLLERDLVGDVYFVKNVRVDKKTGNEIRTLPMIVVALRGEIAINLTGKSSTAKNGRLINTFAQVPDAPIGRFNLNIKGGRNGILAVTRTRKAKINLCANPKSHIADNKMNGQNGKRADYRLRVKTPCGKAGKSKQAKRGRRP